MNPDPADSSIPHVPGFSIRAAVDRMGGDITDYVEFAGMFMAAAPEQAVAADVALREPAETGTAKALDLLHGLRGSALAMGADDLVATLQRIETALKDNPNAPRGPLIADLEHETRRSFAALSTALSILGSTDQSGH